MKSSTSTGARTRARELLLQALYQKQIAGHDRRELLRNICESQEALKQTIDGLIDRPLEQLDPVELGILLIGVYELQTRIDIPYRVVINECVNLAKRFGAIDGHKYINACLDTAAQSLREVEVKAEGSG
jgi:N utilization substance protein B